MSEASVPNPNANAGITCPKCGSSSVKKRTTGTLVIGIAVIWAITFYVHIQVLASQPMSTVKLFVSSAATILIWALIISAIAWGIGKNRCTSCGEKWR